MYLSMQKYVYICNNRYMYHINITISDNMSYTGYAQGAKTYSQRKIM